MGEFPLLVHSSPTNHLLCPRNQKSNLGKLISFHWIRIWIFCPNLSELQICNRSRAWNGTGKNFRYLTMHFSCFLIFALTVENLRWKKYLRKVQFQGSPFKEKKSLKDVYEVDDGLQSLFWGFCYYFKGLLIRQDGMGGGDFCRFHP